MKTRCLFYLLFPILAFTNFTSSSEFTYTVSKPYKVIDAPEKYYFSDKGDVLTVKVTSKLVSIQKFNAQKMSFQKVTEYEDMPKGFVVEEVVKLNGKVYLFYSSFDKPNEHEELFYREIDFKTGEFTSEGKLLVSVNGRLTGDYRPGEGMFGGYAIRITNKFDMFSSFDGGKILIKYRKKPQVRNDAKSFDKIGLHVFDPSMKKLWGGEFTMPYSEKKMNNLDYSVDSAGNAYMLTTVYNDNTTDIKKDKDGPANYHIELMRVKARSGKIEKSTLALKEKFINKIWLYEAPGSYMICAGFYNKGKSRSAANGVFVFTADNNGKIANYRSFEIPLEVLNQYASKRAQKTNEKKEEEGRAEFDNLELRELMLQDDGGVLLVGEQHYIEIHYHNNKGRVTTTYTYYYNDILVSKISPDGELAWMKKLPKRQKGSKGKGSLSYQYMKDHVNSNHYFIYLDNEKNMQLGLNEFPAYHVDGFGGFLTSYKVSDLDGKVMKSSIVDLRNVKGMEVYQFSTDRILPLNSSTFLFEVYKKDKEDVMVMVNTSKEKKKK